MEYRFTTQVRSLATGKTYSAGQIVPPTFTVTQDQFDQGVVEKVGQKPDAVKDYEDMTTQALYDLLSDRGLVVRGSKAEKIDRLKENDKGGEND